MENQLLSLAVGIVSSLFATGIFIGASELYRTVVLPWYADKIYRGVRIDGRWELIMINDAKPQVDKLGMFLDLTQKGDLISGTYSHRDDDGTIDLYELKGQVRDRYFYATSVPVSNRHLDGAAMLLYIHNKNSEQMLSGQLLYCVDPGKVAAWGTLSFAWRKP